MAKREAKVEELVSMITRGQLRLPEMQRRYVWRATRVRDLLDSLYRQYPSGAILLWETDEDVPLQEFAVSQEHNPYGSTLLLLDGQQRLTSLSAVLRGEPVTVRGRQKPIELLFNLEHPDELAVVTEVHEDSDEETVEDEADSDDDELQRRFERMTFVVATKKVAKLPHWVKVSEVFKSDSDAPFLTGAGVTTFDDPRFTKYSQRLARLRGIRNYTYRMDVLERSLTYEEVTEIFVHVNSLGTKLRGSDLALAQITAKWRGALELFQDFEQRCAKDGFEVDLGIHLRNMVAFATGQSRFLTIGGLSVDQLKHAWANCCLGMEFAISYLKSNLGIDSPALLSSPYLLVTTAYFGYQRAYEVSAEESEKFRYWALTTNTKGRYSRGSSETLLDQDLATLRDGGTPETLIERLRLQVGRLEITAAEFAGRNQRSAPFKTMFLAFRDAGAKDWRSNLTISLDHSGVQHKLQFHHIFPKAYLTKLGHTAREADDIANLAFISGNTNQKIKDTPPSKYLNKLIEQSGVESFRAQCIPTDPELLEPENYDRFLARRRELIADRLNMFLGADIEGARLAPEDPHLRDLNRRIEDMELRLRDFVATTLSANGDSLPPHIEEKVRKRIADAGRNNPPGEASEPPLARQLQFCDLRDLQDAITSKALWQLFAQRLGTKEAFNGRCGQLAELRNTLRHSRDLSDVTRKDGEAALIWFREVLS